MEQLRDEISDGRFIDVPFNIDLNVRKKQILDALKDDEILIREFNNKNKDFEKLLNSLVDKNGIFLD